jgi:hypothetical protein
MAMTGRKAKGMDGHEVMELWVELGSLHKVSLLFQTEGRVNPDSLQPYTETGLWRACSIWMVENPAESRKLYEKAGSAYTDVQWDMFVLRRAIQVYKTTRSTFIRWVLSQPKEVVGKDENGDDVLQEWPRKYEPLYSQHYRIEPEDYIYFAQTERRMPKKAGRIFKAKDSKSVQE